MLVPGSANPLLLRTVAAPAAAGISRSLRFNSADSAYLSRTPASAGNRKTWTWAGWVKRSAVGSGTYAIADARTGSNESPIMFGETTADTLSVYEYSGGFVWQLRTTQVFRDPSAWFHLCIAVDTTQETASNRVKIYVNGSEVTAFAVSTYPSQNHDTFWSTTNVHTIGAKALINTYFNGYLADIYFIDGQALTPSSFTETDATTGQLIPKAFSGSYGSQGWHLEFADNSSNTATTLGKDTSGNGNNWTPNNLSVTAGAGNDSLVDVPVNGSQTDTGVGGQVRGNYCTLNPLDRSSNITLTNGNLDFSNTTAGNVRSTFAVKGVKIYCETSANTAGNWGIGIGKASSSLAGNFAAGISGVYGWNWGGGIANFHSNGSYPWNVSAAASDVFQLAIDASNPASVKLFLGRQNTWYDSSGGTTANPATGANPTATLTDNVDWFVFTGGANATNSVSVNFGQRAFAYTAPSGFKALCTANLPAPLVTKPNTVMDVALYTGNGGNQSITLPGGFNPDLVWVKSRSNSQDHYLFDAIRGGAGILRSNTTGAETTGTTYLSFDTSGFSSLNGLSSNGYTYAGWCWDAGSSTVTNTQGSITSSVRANATAGFSVVTFTCPASGVYSFGHGLGVVPSMVIMKDRGTGGTVWCVYHSSVISNNNTALTLNSTGAIQTFAGIWGNGITSSVVGSTANVGIVPNSNAVAYCFAPVVGYSSFGSYTGNGSSTDGPFVYTGHRSRWIMIKATSIANESWIIIDTARSTYNVVDAFLRADTSGAEFSSSLRYVDILSNGFKLRASGLEVNGSGTTYVYASFAESPFNYARAR